MRYPQEVRTGSGSDRVEATLETSVWSIVYPVALN